MFEFLPTLPHQMGFIFVCTLRREEDMCRRSGAKSEGSLQGTQITVWYGVFGLACVEWMFVIVQANELDCGTYHVFKVCGRGVY